MKILKVQLCNLNSLRGVWTIDFSIGPLAQNGLYAITGPTGAGKTTLLDAITVALYNRVPRHGDKVHEMMSRHTAECYSEVTFEANGGTYRSKWSLRRARGRADGNFQTDKMELADAATGTLLSSHRKTETLEKIQSLTGLDYDQFLRSVLLAQGQFARFLQAKDKERSELLAQMTDTHIFSEISAFVFQKTKDEKTALDTLQAQLGQIVLLSEEALAQIQKEIEANNTRLESIRQAAATQQKALDWWVEEKKLAASEADLAKQGEQQDAAAAEAAPLLQRLALHRQAQPLLPAYDRWKGSHQEKEQLHLSLEAVAKEVGNCILEKERAAAQRDIATQALKDAQHAYEQQKPVLAQVTKLDDTLQLQRQAADTLLNNLQKAKDTAATATHKSKEAANIVNSLQQAQKEEEGWLQEHAGDAQLPAQEATLLQQLTQYDGLQQQQAAQRKRIADNAKAREQTEKNQQALQTQIADNLEQQRLLEAALQTAKANVASLLQGQQPAEIAAQQRKLPGTIARLQQLQLLAAEWQQAQANHTKGSQLTAESEAKVTDLERAISTATEQLQTAEKHKDTLQQLLEKEKTLQLYVAERMALVDGEACPLCGAVHHPFAHTPPPSEIVSITRQLTEQQALIESYRKTQQEKEKERHAALLTLDKYTLRLSELAQTIESKKEAFDQLQQGQPVTHAIDQPEKLTEALQNAQAALRAIDQLWEAYEEAARQQQSAEQALNSSQQQQAILQERVNSITQDLQKLTALAETLQEEAALLNSGVEAAQSALDTVLLPLEAGWPQQPVHEVQQAIRQRAAQYSSRSRDREKYAQEAGLAAQQATHLAQEASRLEAERDTLQQQNDDVVQTLEALQQQREALLGTQSVDDVTTALQQAIQNATNNLETAAHKYREQENNLLTLQTRQSSLEQQQSSISVLLQSHGAALNAQMASAGFAHVDALLQALLSTQQATAFQQIEATLEQQRIALATLRQQHARQKAQHAQLAAPEVSEEALRDTLQQLQTETDQLQQNTGALHQQLSTDAHNRERHAAHWERIALQQQVANRWEQLNSIIGSKEGDKFSRFAQGLTLLYLIQLANGYLHRFNSRYELVKTEGDNLELEICDTWQADMVRPIASLSGGETFLVSLALALGLSALASSRVQIKSLFIDEGFGTLDSETLETALDALENLQAEGNSIGVISHVQAMQERIATQIKIIPVSGGYSRVEVVG